MISSISFTVVIFLWKSEQQLLRIFLILIVFHDKHKSLQSDKFLEREISFELVPVAIETLSNKPRSNGLVNTDLFFMPKQSSSTKPASASRY